MIEVLGSREGTEREVAERLAASARRLWPDLADDRHDRLLFHVGVHLPGTDVQELDLVVLAHFRTPRSFPLPDGREGLVRSLFAVVEVKGHRRADIRFEGTRVLVRYTSGGVESWQDATDTVWKRIHAVRRAVEDELADARPFVDGLLALVNLSPVDLPRRVPRVMAGTPTMERLLAAVAAARGETRSEIAAVAPHAMERILALGLFRVLEPGHLDRRRMDRLVRVEAHRAPWFEEVGSRLVVLRGRGGAGKTVLMLQMAYRLWEERQARSLFLTYNRALVADIRRTMALMGVPATLDRGGIAVESVMAFVLRAVRRFGLLDEEVDPLRSYDHYVATLAQWLQGGAIGPEDVRALKERYPEEFAFDQVFVDEGQDWSPDEVLVLHRLYGPEAIVVAHGVDQLVRPYGEADWTRGVPRDRVRVRHLRRSLRMKANLARFANRVAAGLGLADWEVEPNPEAGGGRVVVVFGDYFAAPELHRRLVEEALAEGNRPVDLLCCVPPQLAGRDPAHPGAAQVLRGWGFQVWDGTSTDVRRDFPTDVEQLRLVQYDSCRGLEGWTTFAVGLDAFWRYKYRQALEHGEGAGELLLAPEEQARLAAARWVMIPLTRAIDTLVVNVARDDAVLRPILETFADEDWVEWAKI